jgi:DNA-directed RNA polymerase subunit RPC12/RpoP
MIVRDIACPACGRVDPVRKIGIDQYRCAECTTSFTSADVEPPASE